MTKPTRPQTPSASAPKAEAKARTRPAAPPVYRPQPAPKVLQKKASVPAPASVTQKRPPVAPPAYRPQPGRKVLQAKKANVPSAPPAVGPKASGAIQRTQAPPPRAPARPCGRPGSGVIQRQLPVGTYVQVHGDGGGKWYGKIESVNEDGKQYGVRVGGTERVVTVPFHKAGLHSAFVASGKVPGDFKTKPLPIPNDVWCYHVTAASNLPNILARGGLVPRGASGHGGAFAGLDPLRGANEVGGTPKRLDDLYTLIGQNPSFKDLFTKKLHDTMLGDKEDFVYATRRPERIFNYADEIRKGGVSNILVLRFRAGGRAWYLDEEDDTAEKSISSIPLSQLQAAKFQRTEADVSRQVASNYLQTI